MLGASNILIIRNGKNDTNVYIFEANMWSNATLASRLRSAGIRTRSAGHALTSLGKILRLRQANKW